MSVQQRVKTHKLPCLDIEQLPLVNFDDSGTIPKQIAAHLRSMLEQYGSGYPSALKLPSLFDLSAFYNQDTSKILEGLFELQAAHYDYIMHGMDEDLILLDPINRKNWLNVFLSC